MAAVYCSCGAQWHGALVASVGLRDHRRLKHAEVSHEQFVARGLAPCHCLPCRQREQRAKMSAATKRALADPAVRAKMSAARKRALADPAVRAKMSAATKRAWADPAVRAKMSAATKRALADPAVRAKMSAATKRAWADPAVKLRWTASRWPEHRRRHHQEQR